jgi:hypothetical protein
MDPLEIPLAIDVIKFRQSSNIFSRPPHQAVDTTSLHQSNSIQNRYKSILELPDRPPESSIWDDCSLPEQ